MTRFKLALAFAVAGFAALAQAQDYPVRQIRVIIASTPGSAPDFIARLLSQHMSPMLGQQILVENRGGGGGVPAVMELMNSQADGYTIFHTDASQWAIFPAMQNVPYDALRDFAPIGLVFTAPTFVAVGKTVPVNDLKELIALAKAKPGTLNYASFGMGSFAHLVCAAFSAAAGITTTHVPYKGGVEAVSSVAAGDTSFTIMTQGVIAPHQKAGNVKVLAVLTATRFRGAPQVPTVAEAGGPANFSFGATSGWVARSGTPKPVIDKVAGLLSKAAVSPEVQEKALTFGLEMTPSTPEQLGEIMRAEVKKYGEVVRMTGLKQQ